MSRTITIMDAETFDILFASANILDLSISDEKRVTKFEVEDGTERSDHSIQLPIGISMRVRLDAETTAQYDALRQAFKDHRLLIVQGRVGSYSPMLIEAMPHAENTDDMDGVAVDITFTEWRTVAPVYGDAPARTMRNPEQASTTQRGQQQTAQAKTSGAAPKAGEVDGAPTKRKGSILHGVFN